MTHERQAIDCFVRWLRVRQRSGLPLPATYDQLVDDIGESRLLRRMLAGRTPLRVAPPRSFGQPWYALVEEGQADGCTVTQLRDRPGTAAKVAINESPWEVVEAVSEDQFVVQYRSDAPLYVVHSRQADGSWTLTRYDLWTASSPEAQRPPRATEPVTTTRQ